MVFKCCLVAGVLVCFLTYHTLYFTYYPFMKSHHCVLRYFLKTRSITFSSLSVLDRTQAEHLYYLFNGQIM